MSSTSAQQKLIPRIEYRGQLLAGVDEAGTEQQGGSDDAVKIGWKR